MKVSIEKKIERIEDINRLLNWLDGVICKGLESGAVAIGVGRPENDGKSDDQREKFHAMIGDIQKTGVIVLPGKKIVMNRYTIEKAKALLVMWFVNEKKELGQIDDIPNPPESFDCPITGETISIRPSTTKWGKKLTSEFIEFLYATGTLANTVWSEPSMKVYEEWSNAKRT